MKKTDQTQRETLFQDAEKVLVRVTIRMELVVVLDMGDEGAQGFSIGWCLKVVIGMVMLIYPVN